MRLTYGQIEAVLVAHLLIHPDKVLTFRSRIKQLQRLEFPPGVNVGRGAKMEYTGEHLFQLVTVFELIGFGFPAQSACNTVREYWQHFAAGYALSALQDRSFEKPKPEQILAILWLQSLHELQFDTLKFGDGQASPSAVKICDESAAKRELKSYDFNRHYSRLFISIGAIFTRIIKIALERAGVAGASCFDQEFNAWLPKGEMSCIDFKSRYPDRSNLELRRRLDMIYGNDPESSTPEGEAEAKNFVDNDYSFGAPF